MKRESQSREREVSTNSQLWGGGQGREAETRAGEQFLGILQEKWLDEI